MVPDIHEIYNFEQLLFEMSHFNFYSILFYSQTCQQRNSSLALQQIRRSYQVLLCPIKKKWYQTYSRFNMNDCYRLLYYNTKLSLLQQLFISISKLSTEQIRSVMRYFKSQVLSLIQSFCQNYAKVFLTCVNPLGQLYKIRIIFSTQPRTSLTALERYPFYGLVLPEHLFMG